MTTERELISGFAQSKVKGGKMVRLHLIHDGESVRSVRITGDFLLHPEEALERIEMGLNGLPVHEDRDLYLSRIEEEVRLQRAQLIGFSEGDIADLVMEAME